MNWSVLISFILVLGIYGTRAEEDIDFTDIDWILQQPLRRFERSPDYGAGLGGPLAASGAPPGTGGSGKPAPAPAPAPKPAPAPAPKPAPAPAPKPAPAPSPKPAPAPAPKPAPASSPSATTKGPTAASKAPAKQEKSDGGGGGGTNGKSGEEIANEIYNHPNECKDPANGGVWAPLPSGQKCGPDGDCPYPQKWCSAKQEDSTSNSPKLSCQDLPPDCQKALSGDSATTAASTAAPAADTTSQQASTSTAATTKPSTAATQKATTAASSAGTTAAPGGDCKDSHPYCCFWADDKQGRPSECDRNTKWMKTQCGKSCGTCGCTTGDCPTKVNTAGCQWTQGGGGQGQKTRVFLGGGPSPFGNLGGSPGTAGTGAGPVPPAGGSSGSGTGGSPTMTKIFIGK